MAWHVTKNHSQMLFFFFFFFFWIRLTLLHCSIRSSILSQPVEVQRVNIASTEARSRDLPRLPYGRVTTGRMFSGVMLNLVFSGRICRWSLTVWGVCDFAKSRRCEPKGECFILNCFFYFVALEGALFGSNVYFLIEILILLTGWWCCCCTTYHSWGATFWRILHNSGVFILTILFPLNLREEIFILRGIWYVQVWLIYILL